MAFGMPSYLDDFSYLVYGFEVLIFKCECTGVFNELLMLAGRRALACLLLMMTRGELPMP